MNIPSLTKDQISCEWIIEAKCKSTKDQLCACLIKLQKNLNNNRKIWITEYNNYIQYSGICGKAKAVLWVSIWEFSIYEENSKEIRNYNKENLMNEIKQFIKETNPDPYTIPTHTYRSKDLSKYIIEFENRWIKNDEVEYFKQISH